MTILLIIDFILMITYCVTGKTQLLKLINSYIFLKFGKDDSIKIIKPRNRLNHKKRKKKNQKLLLLEKE